MTHQEKKEQAIKQVKEMMQQLEIIALHNLGKALQSGAVNEEFMEDNYLLAKCCVWSAYKDDPYGAKNTRFQIEFNNIHKFL